MPKYQNIETGEIHLVGIVRRPRHRDGFGLVFQEPLLNLLGDAERRLSALEWRLLLYLIATMEYENIIDAHIGELAEGIGHERSAVSKALTKLEGHRLVRREDMPGSRPRRIRVNPDLAFRGNASQRGAAKRDFWA